MATGIQTRFLFNIIAAAPKHKGRRVDALDKGALTLSTVLPVPGSAGRERDFFQNHG